ncbi:trypsin-like peptidase domain-containing protein [Hellea sp.]|nr:trypsin-like peptidase domain-containing protein [Hellea sp.]
MKKNYLGAGFLALCLASCDVATSPDERALSENNEVTTPTFAAGFADVLAPQLNSVVRVDASNIDETKGTVSGSIGSGAIIDAENGYVLTNAHVVAGATDYAVQLLDGRSIVAELVGKDVPTDIALLKMDAPSVKAITITDSDKARVGDLVFAVGYPFGLDQTVSLGIVSGLGRSTSSTALHDFIQTDAAINTGNSGGPLLDNQGALIGVNTAILSKSGGSIGIGFSIPSRIAMRVVDQLKSFGEVHRGSIGVSLDVVSEAAAKTAGTPNLEGALIASVDAGSPAEIAGLEAEDVITRYDGRPVKTPTSLRTWIGVSETGVPVDISLFRRGEKISLQITPQPRAFAIIESISQLGMSVESIVDKSGVKPDVSGVLVTDVVKGSPADLADMRVGDVVLSINNEKTSTPAVCDRIVHGTKGRVLLLVYRDNVILPVIIEMM